MKMKIKKTALVTGISRGIGQAIAKKLVSEGYFVHGTYNTGKKEAKQFLLMVLLLSLMVAIPMLTPF